jgi:hypothetical protein
MQNGTDAGAQVPLPWRQMRLMRQASALVLVGLVTTAIFAASAGVLHAQVPAPAPPTTSPAANLDDARRAFYNANYDTAATLTHEACDRAADLAACELRTSSLLFQIRRLIGDAKDQDKAWQQCATCPALFAAFKASMAKGVGNARAALVQRPEDDDTQFLLGKLNLNYVWLQLGTLGRRTGWSEYWEGRRSLDSVLARRPDHVRAIVARGWIDYIVATKMRRGTRWLLGGGNKNRGLLAIRNAAAVESEFFTRTEARFALWDMQVRERDMSSAAATAAVLLRDFPENPELKRFVEQHGRADARNTGERSLWQ